MSLDKLKVNLQYVMPKHGLSRLVGKFAASEAGPLTTAFIKWFIRQYDIKMEEAVQEDPKSYRTFNEFFTRPLKPGLRPLAEGDDLLLQPVDGCVSQCGPIRDERLFQAKGHDFGLKELLGGFDKDAEPFKEGHFATIYLSPQDYHRIHMPVAGTLRRMIYVPGDLFSVNPLTTQNVPGLFARNERVVTIFDTEHGPMAMVLVGATIVASIETVWAGTVTPPTGSQVFDWDYPAEGEHAIHLAKGEEMGRFKLGSTVVACFGRGMVDEFDDDFEPGKVTRLGRAMAKVQDD
ncbi:phosphatidylserine decarboxylase [Ferrimonas balearica DSM 9799]|uniref:Phosphatidylserine decarboxylase proenzyme n=1 Tax=Ferrimonas balearica (strain DSM 9799 / CCM 4581 / KCTC 23876 / PAT) TaxID=550540 RepID=E1SPQ6_FERBD|nr:phosphatidylserine decarboxylase [Ferrimonas balearica DSM 9799]MBY6096371.1 archaetidylserine decarboxylase [Ferrimonas balearica]